MISRQELITRRRIVKAFIDADYADVSFITKVKVKTPAGAFVLTDSTPRDPQRIRLIPANHRFGNMATNSEAGEIDRWPYLGIGSHKLEIAKNDHFFYRDGVYQVMSVEPDTEERTLFSLDFLGNNRIPNMGEG